MNERMKLAPSTFAMLFGAACLAPALAQDNRGSTVLKSPAQVIQEFKLYHEPVEPKEFVRATRPPEENLRYIEVHSGRQDPPGRVMTTEELAARERELDAIRARHDRIGGRQRVAGKFNTVAVPPKPAAAKPAPFPCQITCRINPRHPTRFD
jgi:hypothetical protein